MAPPASNCTAQLGGICFGIALALAMADSVGESRDGKELFLELLRHFPTAKLEDYFKNGRWLTDLILMDTDFIAAHRRESGAPDPPPIEEIEIPPELKSSAYANRPSAAAYSAPPANATAAYATYAPSGPRTAPSVTPAAAMPRAAVTPAAPLKEPPRPASALAQGGGLAGAQTELRMIATFVQKWQLDPTRTKLLLARLTPARRKQVIDGFSFSASRGLAPTAALEQYIQQGNAPAAGGSLSGPASRPITPAATPMKRPLPATAATAQPAAKRAVPGAGLPAYTARTPTTARTPAARPTSAPPIANAKATSGPKPGDLIKNLLGSL